MRSCREGGANYPNHTVPGQAFRTNHQYLVHFLIQCATTILVLLRKNVQKGHASDCFCKILDLFANINIKVTVKRKKKQ